MHNTPTRRCWPPAPDSCWEGRGAAARTTSPSTTRDTCNERGCTSGLLDVLVHLRFVYSFDVVKEWERRMGLQHGQAEGKASKWYICRPPAGLRSQLGLRAACALAVMWQATFM